MGVGGRGRNLAEGTWQPELSRCGRRDRRMCLEASAPEELHPCPPSALPGHRRNGPANMRPSTTIRADHSPWVRGPQAIQGKPFLPKAWGPLTSKHFPLEIQVFLTKC